MYSLSRKVLNNIDVGWFGLGRMGAPMALQISKQYNVLAYDPFKKATLIITDTFNLAESANEILEKAPVIFCSLPTSNEVSGIVDSLINMKETKCKILVDCSSGEYSETIKMSENLLKEKNISLIDCPVSGGPEGAENGNVTAFIGGKIEVIQQVEKYIQLFAKENRTKTGSVGSAHAIKSMNNILNVGNLIMATEGLLALKKIGISTEKALACINKSSGRSLQSIQRIPKEVLTREFDYGFSYGLMEKDIRQAVKLQAESFPQARLIPKIKEIYSGPEAECVDRTLDYTRICEVLEKQAKTILEMPSKN